MKFSSLIYTCIPAIFLCCIGLANCAINESKQITENIPVRWDTGYTMPDLLASSDVSIKSIDDL
jgi:hypothetical protein